MPDIIVQHWGDIASVGGLVVSLLGFWYTIEAVSKAKDAAQQATEAASPTFAKLIAEARREGAPSPLLAHTSLDRIALIWLDERNEHF